MYDLKKIKYLIKISIIETDFMVRNRDENCLHSIIRKAVPFRTTLHARISRLFNVYNFCEKCL